MNIKRFNESADTYPRNAGDRNTDFFKNSKLKDFFKKENKFYNMKENMLSLINEFVELNREYFLEEYEIHSGDIIDFEVSEVNRHPDNRLALKIKTSSNYHFLRNIDFKELVEFINDPELLRNHKKFNI
jgi:hypothetical protein